MKDERLITFVCELQSQNYLVFHPVSFILNPINYLVFHPLSFVLNPNRSLCI